MALGSHLQKVISSQNMISISFGTKIRAWKQIFSTAHSAMRAEHCGAKQSTAEQVSGVSGASEQT